MPKRSRCQGHQGAFLVKYKGPRGQGLLHRQGLHGVKRASTSARNRTPYRSTLGTRYYSTLLSTRRSARSGYRVGPGSLELSHGPPDESNIDSCTSWARRGAEEAWHVPLPGGTGNIPFVIRESMLSKASRWANVINRRSSFREPGRPVLLVSIDYDKLEFKVFEISCASWPGTPLHTGSPTRTRRAGDPGQRWEEIKDASR
jgi:hypothetical protein